MKKLLLATALFLLPLSAQAATAQIQFLDDSGAVQYTASATVDNTFAPRFFAAYGALYGQVPIDPSASPVVMRNMTPAEIYAKFSSGFMDGVISNIQAQERAAAAAAIQTTPVVVTPINPQ